MHKAIKDMKDILPSVDLLIEVIDARIPYSSENPVIAKLRGTKPCIKLLSKSDLADPMLTQRWVDYFEREHGVKAMAVTTEQPEKIRNLISLCKKLVPHKVGGDSNIDALITGIPNVGKSTIINTLAGRAVAKTGNEPAVTKGQQRINLKNGIMLIDSPGILWPKIENEDSGYRLAITGAIKDTAMSYDDIGFYAIGYLMKAYPELIKARYKFDILPSSELEFFEIIGKQRGCLAGGGLVDLNKITKILINELRSGMIGRITLETPEDKEREEKLVAEIMAAKEEADNAQTKGRRAKFKENSKKES
jgi:ribosome biogenesis GTPase A